MRTLLNHEWLSPVGGSENVFEQLMETFPEASTACLWNDAPDRFGTEVIETWLARTPLRRTKAASLLLMRSAWRHIDLSGIDRVISSSHAFGHHLAGRAAGEGKEAFAYVHSPARYIWAPEHDQRGRNPFALAGAGRLRALDVRGVHPGVQYAANSKFVRDRIRTCWRRDAVVIYPPVDVERIQSIDSWRGQLNAVDSAVMRSLPDVFVLGASRLVEYKRLDVAIEVGEGLGIPVVLGGTGPDEARLRNRAAVSSVPVHFTGHASRELLYSLYESALLFVFPAVEDFGIMPVEAMALGTPVLVNEMGGSSESVALIGGGAAVDIEDRADVLAAAKELSRMDMSRAQQEAEALSLHHFRRGVESWVVS